MRMTVIAFSKELLVGRMTLRVPIKLTRPERVLEFPYKYRMQRAVSLLTTR